MNKKPLILLVLILLSLPLVATAQVAAIEDDKISETEKKEMIAFTKRFVAEMQKSRDIGPLLNEFFVPTADVTTIFMEDFLVDGAYHPTSDEATRLARVFYDLVYISTLAEIIAGDNYKQDFRPLLPQRLARSLDADTEALFDSLKKDNGGQFRAWLSRAERNLKAAQQNLKRRNYEQTGKYSGVLAEREKDELYRYPVSIAFSATDEYGGGVEAFLRRLGPNTQAYVVGTPHGLGPIIVKLESGYRLLGFLAHPLKD